MEYGLKTLVSNGIISSNEIVELVEDGKRIWKGLSDDLVLFAEDYELKRFLKSSEGFNKPDHTIEVIRKSIINISEDYGIPSKQLFPLKTKDDVIKTIKYFNLIKEEYKNEVASNLIDKVEKYGIDVKSLSEEASEVISNLRSDLQGELKAIKDYDKHAEDAKEAGLDDVAEVLSDIAKEEKVHCGELQKVLDTCDKENAKAIEDGKDEAEEKLEEEMIDAVLAKVDESELNEENKEATKFVKDKIKNGESVEDIANSDEFKSFIKNDVISKTVKESYSDGWIPHKCPHCGAMLDPGEICDCQEEKKEDKKSKSLKEEEQVHTDEKGHEYTLNDDGTRNYVHEIESLEEQPVYAVDDDGVDHEVKDVITGKSLTKESYKKHKKNGWQVSVMVNGKEQKENFTNDTNSYGDHPLISDSRPGKSTMKTYYTSHKRSDIKNK